MLYVHLAPSRRLKVTCPCCGGGRLRSKGNYTRKARHLDRFASRCTLIIKTRRYKCLDCVKTFIPQLPGLLKGRHSTEPFRERVYRNHHEGIAASSLAKIEAVGAATVSRIYSQFTKRKAAERITLQCPVVLGIDEHTLHKGTRFATTFCDLKNHRVFDVLPGRSEKDLRPFIASLKGRERVRVVCIDLSSPYRHLIKELFPNARIVADRFHVIRIVLHHFLALCRQIAPEIKNRRGCLAILRMRPSRLSDKQRLRLRDLFNAFPAFEPIYDKVQALCTLLNQKNQTKRQCRTLASKLLNFIDQLETSCFEPLLTLANTLKSWAKPIACMWRFSKNNGITEGFHRKMKLIQRRAYGFRNFLNYRLRVIAHCG
jgi:transposase